MNETWLSIKVQNLRTETSFSFNRHIVAIKAWNCVVLGIHKRRSKAMGNRRCVLGKKRETKHRQTQAVLLLRDDASTSMEGFTGRGHQAKHLRERERESMAWHGVLEGEGRRRRRKKHPR